MPKIIYNEGRVVGLSAYELYVKQHYSIDPNKEPATEREWLASTLALGTSMLLKVQPEDKDINKKPLNDSTKSEKTVSVVDYPLPSSSKLCAASTIIGSYFYGEGHVATNSHFATKITSYGELIKNDSDGSPNATSTEGSDVPTGVSTDWPKNMKNQMSGYLSIIDGVVIQPGIWSAAKNTPPQKDLVPNMAGVPTVRLQIKGKIETAFFVLLVGFTNRVVVTGESGIQSGSTNSPDPQDGDFIGPAVFPWGSKIIFTTPTAAINVFMKNKYQRKLPYNASASKIASGMSIIDMEDYSPNQFTNDNLKAGSTANGASIKIDVEDFATWGNSASVVTAYSKDNKYPSVLYGAKISGLNKQDIYPLDVAAPGTVKMFESGATKEEMQEYESAYPGTTALRHDSDGSISIIHSGKLINTSETVTVSTAEHTEGGYASNVSVKNRNGTEKGKIKALSLTDTDGNDLSTDGSKGSINIKLSSSGGDISNNAVTYSGSFSWRNLLYMLANDYKANISMTVDKINAASSKQVADITRTFTTGNYSNKWFGVGKRDASANINITNKVLAPYQGSDYSTNENEASHTGFYRILLTMQPSNFATISKFSIDIQCFLREQYEPELSDNEKIATYMMWRSSNAAPISQYIVGYPLFYVPNDSMKVGEPSPPVIYETNVTDDEIEHNDCFKYLTSGNTMTSTSANFLWQIQFNLRGHGDPDIDKSKLIITDRSFPTDSRDKLDVYMINSSASHISAGILPTEANFKGTPSFKFTISGYYITGD